MISLNGRSLKWITVTEEQEAQAKEIRHKRDGRYSNLYSVSASDERWVGDLGEIVFDAWSRGQAGERLTWILENAAGKADFISHAGVSIGVKTVKRKGPPLMNYEAQISVKHASEPVDQFFFMSYEIALRRMWLLGGIGRIEFLRKARHYRSGEAVHSHYVIRPGHEIYNIGIRHLNDPWLWIRSVV